MTDATLNKILLGMLLTLIALQTVVGVIRAQRRLEMRARLCPIVHEKFKDLFSRGQHGYSQAMVDSMSALTNEPLCRP